MQVFRKEFCFLRPEFLQYLQAFWDKLAEVFCSVSKSCPTLCSPMNPWTAAHQASLSFTISQSLLKFMSIESVVLSNHLLLCRPVPSYLQSFPASGSFPMSWLFTSGGQIVGSFSFRISPSNEYWGLSSFRIDWFDFAVQGTLKSLSQHHNSKASILQAFSLLYGPILSSVPE